MKKFTNFNKWFYCFVEWEENGEKNLSCIPWLAFFDGIFAKIFHMEDEEMKGWKWKWVPPWDVQVGNAK